MIAKGAKWILNIINVEKRDLNDDLSRRVKFSNIVFFSLPIVYIIFFLLDLKSYVTHNSIKFDQFNVLIIIIISLLCLWLNKIKLTLISRNLFLASWPLLMHIIPLKLLDSPSDYFLAFPIGIIFHSILIQLMLSHRNQSKQFWCWMGINLLTIIYIPTILGYFDTDKNLPKEIIFDWYYTLDTILYWLLFNLVIFYIILELERNIDDIKDYNSLIENQKEELNILNENLEFIVRQRTLAIEEQNKKLKNHAFYNAHLLRGPFCRIQGLLSIKDLVDSKEDEFIIKEGLKQSIEELDRRIHEIQEIVKEDLA